MDKEMLRKALIEEGYQNTKALDATVDRLIALSAEPLALLEAWLYKNVEPRFDAIEGIDSNFLREKLQMKNPAVILAYSMLLDSPKKNAAYFMHLSENKIGFYPSPVKKP